MKLVVASDEKTYLTDEVIKYLRKKGHQTILIGALKEKNDHWVEIGQQSAKKILKGEAKQGILFCFSGTGIAMAANRFKGIRAALCWDAQTARLARKWDNANVLVLSLRFTSSDLAKEIIDAFFSTKFDEEGFNEAHKLDE
ncbi:RpiB/LacA/LacB family sugar-phosphate isomerase [Candidatus Daviesbacteria bacterium]|nr:RpiB/LacA/LacB family sugar-phosphate isomerase [Candidatus Daviesbacteria bacterium]